METILKEYKEFLQSILDAHSKMIHDAASKGSLTKFKALENFTVDYHRRSIDRAMKILSDNNLTVDKEKLPGELANIIKEYSLKFLEVNFKTE